MVREVVDCPFWDVTRFWVFKLVIGLAKPLAISLDVYQTPQCCSKYFYLYLEFSNPRKLVESLPSFTLRYLYKRLRCLGNKSISQALTLTFLAIWHGFYSGYYVNFFLEFVTIYAEKQVRVCAQCSFPFHFPFLVNSTLFAPATICVRQFSRSQQSGN